MTYIQNHLYLSTNKSGSIRILMATVWIVTVMTRSFFYFTQQQHPLSPRHAIYQFLLPILISLLNLKYQGNHLSPFETHQTTTSVAIFSLLLYCLACDFELRISSGHPTPAYAHFVHRVTVVFGSLSSVSLASFFFPDPIRPALFLLCILFSAGELMNCRLVKVMWNWFQQRMRGNLVHDTNTHERRIGRALIHPSWYVGHTITRRRSLLPV